MESVLARWLDLLKASSLQLTGLTLAAGAFLYLLDKGTIPATTGAPWLETAAWGAVLVFGSLAVASIVPRVHHLGTAAIRPLRRRRHYRRAVRAFEADIPRLSEDERRILGYLRAKNQKTFEAAIDGGHARMLIAKGYITPFGRTGQHIDFENVPMVVAQPVWDVIHARPDDFPHRPVMDGRVEVHPWREHWMER